MGSSIQKNGLTLFLLSDQAIITLNKENVPKFFRNDEQGNCHEVDAQGKPINSTRAIFPSLTYRNHLSRLYFERTFYGKKTLFFGSLDKIKKIINTLDIGIFRKKLVVEFTWFLIMFLGDIPPVYAFKEDIGVNRNTLQTTFFDIDVTFFKNEHQEKTDSFFSYLELQYVLEKVYPDATPAEIAKKRAEICAYLRKLGFGVEHRRVPLFKIPKNFRDKISTSGLYKQHKSVFSYGFCGIRLLNSHF